MATVVVAIIITATNLRRSWMASLTDRDRLRSKTKTRPRLNSGPGFFVNCSNERRTLQLRLAAQFAASVTATGALTVVRFRDLAIVLGHVISSIWNSWLLIGSGNLVGKLPIAKRGGDIQRSLFVSSSLCLPVGGIESILQTPQDVRLRIFGGRIGLSLTDDVFGGNLLTEKIGSLRPQVVSILANLSQAF